MATDLKDLSEGLRARSLELLGEAVAPRDRDLLELRIERWLPDLIEGLSLPYGHGPELVKILERLLAIICARYAARSEELKRLDLARQLRPDWFQDQATIGYVCYADRFAGSLRGVTERLDYLSELGVTYLHLMPLLQPRPGENDGGYAVSDFRAVDPRLGNMDDLEALTTSLRARGISLCIDLVINHVAREHWWARKARAGDPRYQRYFRTYPDREEPDRWEASLPEVFPDFSPGNFTFDPESGRWIWTTFNDFQWDLRWENPEILLEFADLILDLANRGVEVFRLDAVAFIWKRLGTDCQNQPEVHALIQALRAVARIAAPAIIFKAEAIVAPHDLISYLGWGRRFGRISDLAYHNSLMVQIWSSLATRDTRLMTCALGRFPTKPSTTAWATYVRCHDDIGWAVADEDAASVGWEGPAHRRFLADFYEGSFPGSHARGADFQTNPKTGDRRTSGSAASLAGLELAQELNDPILRRRAIERLLLAYSLILSWDGIPLIYMGDELALLNDRGYLERLELSGDNRWMHRPEMPWDRAALRHIEESVEAQVYGELVRMIKARKATPQLHASSPVEVIEQANPRIFVHVRPHPLGDLVAIHSFSEHPQVISSEVIWQRGIFRPTDRISGRIFDAGDGWLRLDPYARLWLVG
jgi:amylosucrase